MNGLDFGSIYREEDVACAQDAAGGTAAGGVEDDDALLVDGDAEFCGDGGVDVGDGGAVEDVVAVEGCGFTWGIIGWGDGLNSRGFALAVAQEYQFCGLADGDGGHAEFHLGRAEDFAALHF